MLKLWILMVFLFEAHVWVVYASYAVGLHVEITENSAEGSIARAFVIGWFKIFKGAKIFVLKPHEYEWIKLKIPCSCNILNTFSLNIFREVRFLATWINLSKYIEISIQ